MRLNGEREIREYLGWNRSKFHKHLSSMQEAGAVLYERKGHPPRKCMWTLKVLIERWLVMNAQAGKIF
jgi:hypothetical protein